ncbi:MAG TPA: beta-ketoacyl synthase N-terminal-like domain-containing protein [Longimicrobium sp.]|nr:beta-ketoacyl synthase N-terminal-like domain-containing protein [Longimicrobium sp.]
MSERAEEMEFGALDVAVVGMAGRFPGADDLETFWSNLREGVESITHFTVDELRAAGVPDEHLAHPDYVRSVGRLRDTQHFDAAFFGYSPREAESLEPAHRIFLECAWEALEMAGYAPETVGGRVGIYAGAGSSGYTERHVMANPAALASVGAFQAMLNSGKDFLATRAAYKLDLRGPAITVQTACSTSLVAVHLGVQSLLSGECDMALAGGSTVLIPQDTGYLYAPGSIASPDGHCRAFDAESAGTLSGSGVGVVVLKRLADAARDGDVIHAVIKGSAINNDGASKVAFTAPGVEGQAAVIGEALAAADVDPATVTYVEAHGSGTDLGDAIEIAALTRAYRASTDAVGFCAVGAVKTNVGHLDAAAGVTGFIKTVLALEHGEIPPTVHFKTPNPKLDLPSSPFHVPSKVQEWKTPAGVPRRAGVSSFGMGGTNAHVILEEAPALPPSGPSRPWQLLTLSARTPTALDAATDRLAEHLRSHPDQPLADVAFTLREGRRAFPHRRIVVVREGEDAAKIVGERTPERTASGLAEAGSRSVAFLFPGLGDHYPNMARGLYEAEPVFRTEVDRCAEILRAHIGNDIREVIFPGEAPSDAPAAGGFDLKRMLGKDAEVDPSAERLNRTELAQPAVFVVDYALAKLWMSFGVVPDAVIGHSLGEYAAACIAGIVSLEDALALVADRARIIQELPGGAMLAVSMDPDAVRPYLTPEVAIATVNAPGLTVVSGPVEAVEAVKAKVEADGRVARRLATTHAFHSPMMAPAAERLAARIAKTTLRAPTIPMISNVTGTWITDAEAGDPGYWTRHMLGTVRFAEGIAELLKEPGRVLLEVGPGQTLSTFVRQRPVDADQPAAVVPSVRYAYDRKPDGQFLLEALGRLWLAGVAPEWKAFRGDEHRRRVVLPTYPWERQRYWIAAPTGDAFFAAAPKAGRRADAADWTYVPTWTRTPVPAATDRNRILVLTAGRLGDELAAALERGGRDVVLARRGDAFSGSGRRFSLRPDSRDDHRALARALAEADFRPEIIVDARSADVDAATAFGALLLLADAAGKLDAELVTVTEGAQEVTGDEPLEPRAAALHAATRTIPLEYPSLKARAVDVVRPAAGSRAEEETAARLAIEVVATTEDNDVAYRGRHRWARGFRAVRPSSPAAAVREGGAYLMIGDLNGRGAHFAEAVADAAKVRIALADVAVDPALVARLEASGAEVLSISANPMDPAGLREAVARAEGRFGRIDGVVWAPELGKANDLAGIGEAKPAEWAAQVGAVEDALGGLEAALEGRTPVWVVLESSLADVLGVLGRVRVAAAHALIDACAVRRARGEGARWTSAAWDHWGSEADIAHGDGTGMADSDIPGALAAVLALAGEPHVLVSPLDVEDRIRMLAAPAAHAAHHGTLYERPPLDTEYAEPTNEVEEGMVVLWQELLGVDRIGIHDDFFGLGGHSLMATQIISRVRDTFQLELSLAAIFEAPTVAKLSALVEEAIIAELEMLSDEEAAELIGR